MIRVSVVDESHAFIRRIVRPGDFVIDATAGNGFDTVLLSTLVGEDGRVVAIDCQPDAIEATRQNLDSAGLLGRCILVEGDHSRLAEIAATHVPGMQAGAVMFNLGYLPGGDKSVTTRPASTIAALAGAAGLLRADGGLSVVVYRGHRAAIAEANAVEQWAGNLIRDRPGAFDIVRLGRDGYPEHRPYVLLIRRTA